MLSCTYMESIKQHMIIQQPSIERHSESYFFIFSGDKVLQHRSSEGIVESTWQALSYLHHYHDDVIQVGTHQGKPCYLVDLNNEQVDDNLFERVALRAMMMSFPDFFEVLARAWQVALFLRTHQFCGQCGHRMHNVQWELAMACDQCGHRCYPRISPCIIVSIRKDDKILLAQGKHFQNNLFSTLAGFVESGESLEQAVHREVREEVGVCLKNVRYFGSQPWPFPHSLMCGFLADWDANEITIDQDEIVAADWFSPDDLPNIPPTFSISGKLIRATLAEISKS